MKIRIRTIFFAVTIFAIATILLSCYLDRCRSQQAFVKWCISKGGSVGFDDNAGLQREPPGFVWKLIGREGYFPVGSFHVRITSETDGITLLNFLIENEEVLAFVEFSKDISIEFANKFVGFKNLYAFHLDENNRRLSIIEEGKRIKNGGWSVLSVRDK